MLERSNQGYWCLTLVKGENGSMYSIISLTIWLSHVRIEPRLPGPEMSSWVTGKNREMSGGRYEATDGLGTKTDPDP